jgi:hypothetical protein
MKKTSKIQLIVILLGYALQGLTLAHAQTTAASTEQQTFSSTVVFSNSGAQQTLPLSSIQDVASLNEQNNFTQQAYKLDQESSQKYFALANEQIQVQKTLTVRNASETRNFAMRDVQKIVAYKLEQGSAGDNSAVALQSTTNSLNARKTAVTNNIAEQKVFAANLTSITTNFNAFEVLRC